MSIEKSEFGKLADGQSVERYRLKNAAGMSAELLTYGCRIAKLCVPDRAGKAENVILGHDTLAEYEADSDVHGAVVGRYANRIAGAEFQIHGKTYRLRKNEGQNSLHSAPGGFQTRIWSVRCAKDGNEPSVTFAYHSPEGECGFPGNLDAEVTYTLTADNALVIEYAAQSDAETPLNMTNHAYFNLTGNPGCDILSVEMQIFADKITAADKALIPTGEFLAVDGTPFDFRRPKAIGRDIGAAESSLRRCGGYDHNFVLAGPSGAKEAACLHDAASGRRMIVFTDLPGLQLYTANSFTPGATANGGIPMQAHHAVCLETQYFPDSPHHPEFPYENLKPGKTFHSTTVYQFTAD